MEQDNDLLAAFLAHPGRPAAANAYIDWLERLGDLRGEYLRLLIGLDEPADSQTAGPERRKLREMHGRVDAKWADAIDRTRLQTGGLYQADERDYNNYLRFYPNGGVLSAASPGTAADVWKWLTVERSLYSGPWTLRGDEMSFFISKPHMDPEVIHPRWSGDNMDDWRELCEQHNAECMSQRTEYAGVIGPKTLALRWHSYANGAEGACRPRFVDAPLGPSL